jgi:hypothetical protein
MRHDLRDDGAENVRRARPAGPYRQTSAFKKRGINDMLKLLIFLGIWFALMFFILPRLGVPT